MRRVFAAVLACVAVVAMAAAPDAGARSGVTAVSSVKAVAAPGAFTISWATPAGAGSTVVIAQGFPDSDGTPYYPTRPDYGLVQATLPSSAHSWINGTLYGGPEDFYFSVFTENSAGTVAAGFSKVHVHLTVPAKATSFVAYYAVPLHTAAKSRTAAIRRDLGQVVAWYKAQTKGRTPRFARTKGVITVHVLHLAVTAAQLQAKGADSLAAVERALVLAKAPAASLPVVYVEGAASAAQGCGIDGGPVAVLWMHSCGGIYPATSDVFPYGATYLAAHEMTHAMGAVADCAPHSTKDGHVNDSPSDVLYEGPKNRTWSHIVLDYKHDDYYDNKGACTGITHDAVWIG